MGEEFKSKGVNIALGPGMNMQRTPAAGRNWEMAGADPYLAGESAFHTTKGLQDAGVQACAKHLVANDQEINRSECQDKSGQEVGNTNIRHNNRHLQFKY